ncbi:MAG: hypothetical protein DRJ42_14650 [Deltaproteobacteria bacterium]|nr:MAG: hypothetical protein DRJ42_14650 [Deltaproteobacteria bacterium]
MKPCALCRIETADDDLFAVSGLDFCSKCRNSDPTDELAARDIACEWDTRMARFSAGLGIADQDPDFYLKCTPELWFHKVRKVVSEDFEVGDASFDDQIWVQTSKPAVAGEVLANEGVRRALLTLLTHVRVNELVGNHVTLKGPTLLISMRPLGGLSEDKILQLKMQATALALHLRYR